MAAEARRYDEARQAFTAAGQPERAAGMLAALHECSVTLRRFDDAAYNCYQMATHELAVRPFPGDTAALAMPGGLVCS